MSVTSAFSVSRRPVVLTPVAMALPMTQLFWHFDTVPTQQCQSTEDTVNKAMERQQTVHNIQGDMDISLT